MKSKLSENLLYSTLNQIFSIIMSLVTGPYIARVLSPELIGSYSFANANSAYFVLMGSLGLGQYGMIQAAAKRDNQESLSSLFWEITFLKLILSGISMGAYALFFLLGDKQGDKTLYWIMTINIIANMVDITWLANGMEAFKAMALRGMIVRVASFALIMILVRDEGDLYIYAILMQMSVLLANCSMYVLLKGKIHWVDISSLNIHRHLLPSLIYFIPGIVNKIFTAADKSMLGILSSKYEVGIYEQANKITLLCSSTLNSVSNVLLARAVVLFRGDEDKDHVNTLMVTAIRAAGLLILPVTLGIAAVSAGFVPLFLGAGYEKSAIVLKVFSLQVLFSTLANYYSHQCMIARGHQKEYNIAVVVTAVLNVVLNRILISRYASVGAAATSAVSSFFTLTLLLCYGKDVLPFTQLWGLIKKYVFAAVIMYIMVSRIFFPGHLLVTIIIQIVLGCLVYLGVLVAVKDSFFCSLMKIILKSRH